MTLFEIYFLPNPFHVFFQLGNPFIKTTLNSNRSLQFLTFISTMRFMLNRVEDKKAERK